MVPRSIRWRLPMSYAGIAMLAVLLLGAVLLLTLRGYYLRLESDYLVGNADAISTELSPVVGRGLDDAALQSYVQALALLAQVRVRFLLPEGDVLADSGHPRGLSGVASLSLDLQIEGSSRAATETLVGVEGEEERSSEVVFETGSVDSPEGRTRIARSVVVTGDGPRVESPAPERSASADQGPEASSSAPGPGLGLDLDPALSASRSDKVLTVPVRDSFTELLGYVELSEGPAFGREVLNSVATIWAIASGVAVVVAAAVGWLVSRRLTGPILHLAEVSGRMAQGELSVRANLERADELGELAASYNEMAERVEETVLTLRRFVGDAAHQLLTPLTALRTNLELEGRDLGEEQRDSFVARAQTQLDKLDALCGGLLDLSRLEADTGKQERSEFDLAPVLREVSVQFASEAEQAEIGFSLELADGPVLVLGRDGQLGQAVGNLLDNAVKFTPAGGEVGVSLRSEDGWAVLEVEDTGIGIPEPDLAYLFERFRRGGNSARHPGSGLGLTIAMAIAEAHDGDIAATSTAHGSRFTLRVPLAR